MTVKSSDAAETNYHSFSMTSTQCKGANICTQKAQVTNTLYTRQS